MPSSLRIAALAGALAFAFSSAHPLLSLQQREPSSSPNVEVPPEARIDINTASFDQLLKVPGMTRTWAARIMRFRPYRAKNDLLERGIVTSQVYDRIKDYVIAHRPQKVVFTLPPGPHHRERHRASATGSAAHTAPG